VVLEYLKAQNPERHKEGKIDKFFDCFLVKGRNFLPFCFGTNLVVYILNLIDMKKIILIIALLITTLMATAQIDTTGMSDYEKYYYIKTGEIDTAHKNVTNSSNYESFSIDDKKFKFNLKTGNIDAIKSENDDVYYIPSREELDRKKEELKLKQKELRLEKKELRLYQDSLYYDAKQEVYNDLYYTSLIYRFHRSTFYPYWRYNYYSPFYYNPFYYNPFYYWHWDPWFDYPFYYNYWYGSRMYKRWYWESYPRIYNNYYTYNYGNYVPNNINTYQQTSHNTRNTSIMNAK